MEGPGATGRSTYKNQDRDAIYIPGSFAFSAATFVREWMVKVGRGIAMKGPKA